MDLAAELRKAVTYLNTEGGFFNSLQFERIAEAANGLPWSVVQSSINSCVDKRDDILDHTHFLCSELEKHRQNPQTQEAAGEVYVQAPAGYAAGYSEDGTEVMADAEQYSEQEVELWNRIAYMNTEGGFENSIRYDEVAVAAQGQDLTAVMLVLNHLEEKWQEVNDPTSWVCAALHKKRLGKGSGKGGCKGHEGGKQDGPLLDGEGSVRERVMWLNSEGGFQDTLRVDDVAAAATGIDTQVVMKILANLADKRDEVNDPTSWVCAALAKEHPAGKSSGKGWHKGWTEQSWASWQSSCSQDLDRELRRRIAYLNNEGGFGNTITYREIAEAAAGLDVARVMKIFTHLEEKRDDVTNPTSWVCAALWKERGGGGGGGGCCGGGGGKSGGGGKGPPAGRPQSRNDGKGSRPPPPPPPVQKTIKK